MKKFFLPFFIFVFVAISPIYADEAWDHVQKTGELRWGADDAGGAPYVFPDIKNPDRIIGFEVEIMEALAAKLGVKSKLAKVPWDQLVPALQRNDFDMAFNGLEITKDREEVIDFTIPYYFFSEQITVRSGESRFKNLKDLHGHKAGTLSASLAQNILEEEGKISVVPYPSPVEAYKDLEIGRIDAVLMDVPIAAFYAAPNPALQNVGEPVGEGIYAGGIRKDSPKLKEKINEAIRDLINSGKLEQIYKKWNMWTPNQEKLIASGGQSLKAGTVPTREKQAISKFIPLILKGAVVTVILSCLSMALAIFAGFLLCIGKVYGIKPVRYFCNAYIEVIRGTPLLIQLYLLYYGLPNLGIQLNAFAAALLGLGLNYAAYEAEIYRAGLLSVPRGQDEAARSLGMNTRQSLRFIIIPQAFRISLPPSTNDFIALFKDTSLVSIITVTELTRAYSQAATTTYRFLELGLLTALLYFLMSFPLSLWSRSLEKKKNAHLH